ncbi:MAG: terminase [Ramlibacter sp.]|jgi:phage terminase large subunit-like protein|nr:terminase [Ramlibacter sp.]
MEWTTACPDWERRIVARESLIPCAPLFPDQAEEGLRIFKELRAVDVAGSPTLGEISRAWILDLVAAIRGSYDPETGRRLIREVFLLISKKNGKSTDAAGIMLTELLLNWRQSGEMGILAPTIEVANNAWRPARDAIKADEELSDLLHVQDHIRTITHRTTGATLQVVAADSETVAGKKWIVTFVDELWLFGKKPNADRMLLEATGGMASRPEGFVMYSTTQSDEPPAGVFKEKLQYARDVRDGKVVDPAFLPVLYEFPPAMVAAEAHRDPKNFYVTNPNLGASVDEEFLLRQFTIAEQAGEAAMRGFLAKHLNVEIGLNLRSDRWAGADFWERQGRREVTLEYLLEWSEVIDFGIDGGGLDDLLGAAAVGRHRVTREWLHWAHAWAHESVLERRKSEASRLRDFEKDGDLTIVKHMGDDVAELAEIVSRIEDSGLLDKVGADPAGLGGVLDALIEADVPEEKIIGVSQGWKLMGAIKTLERKLAEGVFVHGAQRLMAWAAGNAKVEQRGNALMITKQASGTAKIDPLMATFNAVTLMSLNPEGMGSMDDWLSSPAKGVRA